jgi:hypothetical protein
MLPSLVPNIFRNRRRTRALHLAAPFHHMASELSSRRGKKIVKDLSWPV